MGRTPIDQAAAELAALRRLELERLALTVAAGLAVAPSMLVDLRLAVAFGAGAAVEMLLAGSSRIRRRAAIASLAIDPEAYVLPEVRRYGSSLTSLGHRRALARSIATILRGAGADRSGIVLSDRVIWQAPVLAALARALGDRRNDVEPTAMAACEQLLTDGHRSPLLNPSVPRAELERTLIRILRGISQRRRPGEATRRRNTRIA